MGCKYGINGCNVLCPKWNECRSLISKLKPFEWKSDVNKVLRKRPKRKMKGR